MLAPPERSSAVVVMINSKSVSICNHSRARLVDSSRNRAFWRGYRKYQYHATSLAVWLGLPPNSTWFLLLSTNLARERLQINTYLLDDRWGSVVTVARPPTRSSLKITSRSFRYASPYHWNQLPHSLRQPRLDLPLPDSSLLHSHLTSRVSLSPFLSSITPSLFFSRLKTFSFLKSYPPQTSGTSPDWFRGYPDCFTGFLRFRFASLS